MKANRTAKYLAICAAAALTASCGSSAITGEWTEPVPGMDNMVQGIRIDKGGKASSVNMSTLKYEKWHKAGRSLVLSGKSIGNGQTIAFTDNVCHRQTDKRQPHTKQRLVHNMLQKE